MEDGMIARGSWERFLNLDREELLLVRRQHPFVVVFPIFVTSVLATFFTIASFVIFTSVLNSIPLLITTVLLLISIAITFITKNIIDWYFHLYILTNKKILEIRYTPLSSYIMNGVMLDKVNCTEIDFRTNGLMNELLDMGDVVITFDRPTSQEEFVLRDIESCHNLGIFLTRKLMARQTADIAQTIWFKGHTPLTN
jgi:hypothetical protein